MADLSRLVNERLTGIRLGCWIGADYGVNVVLSKPSLVTWCVQGQVKPECERLSHLSGMGSVCVRLALSRAEGESGR